MVPVMRARPLLIGAIALLIFWVPVSEASGAPAELDVGEILEHVIRTTEFPPGVGFRQEIVLKALFSTWRFESQVRLEPDGVRSKTTGAPSFLPDSFAAELVELGRSPYLFDLKVIQVDDDGVYVLQGPRREYKGRGAREATFWIDSQQWIIQRAEAAYSWGKLHVSQEYVDQSGYRLLARQKARATPMGFTLDIVYVDYQIP